MSKPTAKQITELSKAARQLAKVAEWTPTAAPAFDRVRAALEPFDAPSPAREVTINSEQGLYVIPESNGNGYSCLGFDVLINRYNSIVTWLRKEGLQQDDLPPEARGSMRAYTAYRTLLDRARSYYERNKLRCPAELTPQLIGLEGKRVEVVDCHGERRRFIVGKSTGWLPIHLEIARRDSRGGLAATGAPFQSVRIVA